MDKARWIGKTVWVKPWMIDSPHGLIAVGKGFRGVIRDIKESDITPGLYLTKVEARNDWRWLYPSEFVVD